METGEVEGVGGEVTGGQLAGEEVHHPHVGEPVIVSQSTRTHTKPHGQRVHIDSTNIHTTPREMKSHNTTTKTIHHDAEGYAHSNTPLQAVVNPVRKHPHPKEYDQPVTLIYSRI